MPTLNHSRVGVKFIHQSILGMLPKHCLGKPLGVLFPDRSDWDADRAAFLRGDCLDTWMAPNPSSTLQLACMMPSMAGI